MSQYSKVLMKYETTEEKLLTEILKPSLNSLSKIENYLSEKININQAERYGNNALHHATKLGRIRVLKMLVEVGGGDPTITNHTGQTALIIASKGKTRGHTSCVKFLLQSGCDVNSIDHEGRTALRQAILASNVKSVELLLRFGSDLSWDEHSKLCSKKSSEPVALVFAKSVHDESFLSSQLRSYSIFNSFLPGRIRNIISPNEKIKSLISLKICDDDLNERSISSDEGSKR